MGHTGPGGALTEGPWASAQWPGEDSTLWVIFRWQEGAAVFESWRFSSRQYSGMRSHGSHHSYPNENFTKQFNTEQLWRMLWGKTPRWSLHFKCWLIGRRQFLGCFLAKAASVGFSLYKVQADLGLERGLWCGHLKKHLTGHSWLKSYWGGQRSRRKTVLVRKVSY